MKNYPKLIYFLSELMQLQNKIKLLFILVCIFSMSMPTTAQTQVGLDIDGVAAYDASGNTSSYSFDVMVNDAQNPSISSIEDQNSCPNDVVQVQTSISDNVTPTDDLVISASSSNQSIIPNANIAISNDGNDFEIDLTPVSDVEGDATITISVTDEANNVATEVFDVSVNLSPGLSVSETDYTFDVNEAITPIQIENSIPTNELFASYTSSTSGTLDGVNFTVSALNNSSIQNYNYSNSDWNSVGQKQSIQYNFLSPTITITFESPVENLNFYLYYFRGSGDVSYTFSEDFVVIHGLGGVPTTSSSIDASNSYFASGIIQFVNPITTLTINRTGTTSNLGLQGFNLSKSPSLPTYTVNPALPQGLSLDSSSGEISGTPTESTAESSYTVTGTSAFGCSEDITLNITTNAIPSIASVDDQSQEANSDLSISVNISDLETAADDLTLSASSSNESLIGSFTVSNTGSTRTVSITPETNETGSATVTLTVEDEAGATAQTSFDVTITDYPTVNTQNIDVTLDSSGNANITTEDIDNGSTSISGIASLSIDQSSFSCSDIISTPSSVSLNFEGDGHIQIDGSAPLDFGGSKGFTFETQVYPRSNANSYILSKTLGGAIWPGKLTTMVYINSNNQLVFAINRFSSGGWTYLSTANNTINLNEWQHIAVSYSPANSTMKIFIEGVEVTSTTLNTSHPDTSPGLLRIGASETGSGQFDGYMDDFRAWENELDASEVLAVKNNTISSVDNTLLLHYAFNTNSGTEAEDLSSTQRNGTFTGALSETSWYTGANNLNAEGVTVTFTVTSNSGDVSTGTAIVSVLDDITPILGTQNLTVELDEFGAASISAAQIDNGSSDNCGIETLALDVTTFDCSNLGDNTVTLTATDASGNKASATAIITVIDNTAPALAVKDITVYLDATGTASIEPSDLVDTLTDNCSLAEDITLSIDQDEFTTIGVTSVNVTATDASGRSTTQESLVTVDSTLGYENPDKDVSISLYPNPTQESLNIDASKIDIESISVFDSNGKLIKTSKELTFDVSELSSGIYFAKMSAKNNKYTKVLRFIKE